MKAALAALDATDTVAGTVMFPVELNATVAAEITGPLKVSVQTATAPGASDAGLHASPVRGAAATMEAVPPVVVVAIGLLSSAAAIPPETPTDAEVAPAARVTATVATLPSEMTLLFTPLAMHV